MPTWVAPSRARRNVAANGPLRSPTMGRRYRFNIWLVVRCNSRIDRSLVAKEPSGMPTWVAPSRARRNVPANGPLRSPTMGRRYRFSLFLHHAAGGHGTCQGAGR